MSFNLHYHVLCTDGAFFEDGAFRAAKAFDTERLEKALYAQGSQHAYGEREDQRRGQKKILRRQASTQTPGIIGSLPAGIVAG
jgi:hypothetical protein